MTYGREYFESYGGTTQYKDFYTRDGFRAKLVRRVLRSGRVLEIGCAFGFVLRRLEDNYEMVGIDISKHAIASAKKIVKHANLINSDALYALKGFKDDSFDCILAFDILEHLESPDVCLREAVRVLRRGGFILAEVPNTKCISRQLKKDKWYSLRDHTHVQHLEPSEWVSLFKNSSLNLIKVGTDGFWDVPYVPVLPVALQRIFPLAAQLVQTLSGTLVFPPIGEAIIIVAKKRKGDQEHRKSPILRRA